MSINKIETIGHAVAFPYEPGKVNLGTQGLTKREYFAAMAMQTLNVGNYPNQNWAALVSKDAILLADALIEALNKQP